MSSAALKIVHGLKSIVNLSDRLDWIRSLDYAVASLHRTTIELSEMRIAKDEEAHRLNDVIDDLRFKISSIKAHYIKDCGYFIRGECHRKHCLCEETCRVD